MIQRLLGQELCQTAKHYFRTDERGLTWRLALNMSVILALIILALAR